MLNLLPFLLEAHLVLFFKGVFFLCQLKAIIGDLLLKIEYILTILVKIKIKIVDLILVLANFVFVDTDTLQFIFQFWVLSRKGVDIGIESLDFFFELFYFLFAACLIETNIMFGLLELFNAIMLLLSLLLKL